MQPDVGEGFAADPARLRQAAGAVQTCGGDVAAAAAGARASLAAAGAAAGGPWLTAALEGFERELAARAGACAEAVHAAATALVQTAAEVEAADRLPDTAPGSAPGFREALG